MKLFQYAVIYKPTKKEDKAKLVVEVTTVLANDQQNATLLAGRAIPESYLDQLENLEVVVRPF